MASKRGSSTVAPRERINITYKPAVGSAKESVELPFKVSVLGDFSLQNDNRSVEERTPVNVTAENFDDVLQEHNLKVQFSVPNKMVDGKAKDINIDLDINCLKDMTPDNIVKAVPELQEVFRIREALQALKGPLGNSPQMRKLIQEMLNDEKQCKALKAELKH